MSGDQDQKYPSTGILTTAIQNWSNLRRSLVLFFCVVLILTISFEYIGNFISTNVRDYLSKNHKTTITLTANNGIIFFSENSQKTGSFLLPASSGWINTGFILKSGETIDIRASGRIHLGLEQLVAAAETDTKPKYAWSAPDGNPFDSNSENKSLQNHSKNSNLKNFLVDPNAKIGMLLGFLAKKELTEIEEPGENNPRPKGIIRIGNARDGIKNDDTEDRELWLTINDIYLSEEAKEAYINKYTVDNKKEREEQWDKIKKQKYWRLWFDDNIGEYLINITFQNQQK